MPANLILPLSIVLGLLSFGLIAKWYLAPALSARSRTDGLIALPLGFVDIKVCAVDETWSGLKLVIRKSER